MCFAVQLVREVAFAEPQRATRRQLFAGEHIALHFGKRDIAFGKTAIGVKDRVVGILPALIGQPLFRGALILDEAVAVRITGPVDPAQRRFDRRPQLDQRLCIAGPLDVEAREQHEQRCRIDAAVVMRKRHLAQRRHFAAAHFMQNLAGLGVGERVDCFRLMESKPLQHAARNPRVDPQHLQRGDDAVAAERRRVPGDSRIGIPALRRFRHQHVEVRHRLAEHLVEDVVGGLDAGRALGRSPHLAPVCQ